MRCWKPILLTALMLLSILPALTVDAGESKSSTHAVDIHNFAFNPQDSTIFVGDSITWTNLDSSSHTAASTSGPDSFDSGSLSSGMVFTYTFTSPGSYNYHCSFHPSMTGTVTVENPAVRVREIQTTFTWQPEPSEAQPSNVSIIGEWDWGTHTELAFDVSSGTWSTSISLQEGMYCYKFVVGDNDYRFDESNPYRGYCGDFENSIARVENTSLPALSLDSYSTNEDGFSAHILFWAGENSAAPDNVTVTLVHNFVESQVSGAWNSNNWSLSLSIDELAPGKYTLKVAGSDINNDRAEELLLPFWIGEQSDFIWDDALIYMVMTDRFVDGNPTNNPVATSASQGADWQGGDFAGVTQMIQSGYFNDLGVNALWLTPFNTAANGTGIAGDGQHEVAAYHGYWPIEPRGVDARLGTEAELEELISTAHEHGIRVMGDLVINHVHEDHPYYSDNPDWFNQGCLCGTQNCGWTEHRLDCLFRSYMPDINWNNRDASEQMIADGLWWLERFDLDGARMDAVKHVDDLAIYNFGTQVEERFESMGTDYYLKGETAMGWAGHNLVDNQEEYEMINRYMSDYGLDGQADFVLYHAVVDNVFTSGNMDYQHLDYWTARSQDQYVDGATMVPFIGSHDTPRFTSRSDPGTADEWNQWTEDGLPGQPGVEAPYQSALQAFGWLLTTPGAPMIYMGDEYGEYGGADPDNRHILRDTSQWNAREAALHENISLIGSIREAQEPLRRGSYHSLVNDSDTLVYAMEMAEESVVVILNRGQAQQINFSLTSVPGDWVENIHHDLVANVSMSVDTSNIATIQIRANSVTIFSSERSEQHEAGFNSLFIGHSFFRPFADGMPFHTDQAGITGHRQSIIYSSGASGAPQALWENDNKRAQIQAILDGGDIELFGMTYHGNYPTSEGYENWIEYALTQNSNTRFFLALPWGTNPGDTSAETYASDWHAAHSTSWHDLIETLRTLYPDVEIFCIPYGQSALELRLLFSANNLPDVDSLVSGSGDGIYSDNFGHADDILKELGRLVWLNAIYDVNLTTYSYDPGYITDLKEIAQSIMDAHDATYPEPEPEPGCLDETATNHNPNATIDDGSCLFDSDGDGILDDDEILGCTNSTANNFNANATDDGLCEYDQESIYLNLTYASYDGGELLLDLYVPDSLGPHPLFVYIHGGGWTSGDKMLNPLSPAMQLYSEGSGTWAVASINYRLSDEALWPAQIEDCKAAIRWLKENANTYGIDRKMIVVGGSSAGGHLAAMIAVTNGDTVYDNASLGSMNSTSEVNAVVDWFGPTDLFKMSEYSETMLQQPSQAIEQLLGCTWNVSCSNEVTISASPALLVNGGEPPILLMHGNNDSSVPSTQSDSLAAALAENGSTYWYQVFADSGHGIGNPEWRTPEVMELFYNFLEGVRNGTIVATEPNPEPMYTTCGGIVNLTCAEGFVCVDDPSDDCETENGGRNCLGICIELIPNLNPENDTDSNNSSDNKSESTTSTGGVNGKSIVIYALVAVAIVGIGVFVMMSVRRH